MQKNKYMVAFGRSGERFVAEQLKQKGYFIAAMNYKSPHGEIDIIAENQKFVVFVEVKTSSCETAFPREAVTKQKKRHILYTAKHYLFRSHSRLIPRFDVAEVILPAPDDFAHATLRYFENAFGVENGNEFF